MPPELEVSKVGRVQRRKIAPIPALPLCPLPGILKNGLRPFPVVTLSVRYGHNSNLSTYSAPEPASFSCKAALLARR